MFLLLIQIAVPVLLLAALAVRTRSRAVKIAQAVAVSAYLLALHLAGLWMDLPWWTPWVLWAGFAVALVVGWRQRTAPLRSKRPRRTAAWNWALAAVGFLWIAVTAAVSRQPPEGPVVDLASPLPPGRYLVVNGGSGTLINAHLKTLRPVTARQAAHRGQSYAVDIVGLTRFGRTSAAWHPREPARYAIFGTPILAPCAGVVVAHLDRRPDMPVPQVDQAVMGGNHVALQCGDVQVVLAHFRRGSVAVTRGERVSVGQKLGQVGNSGNSDQPHLHIHVQRPATGASLMAAEPLPFTIEGRYLVRGDRL